MDNGDLSTILLDKHHVTVGETVTLFWNGGFGTSSTDWIGLFYSGDAHSVSNCLDYKQSADTTGKRQMKWLICRNIDFQAAENKCYFKYIHGASGSVKAISQVLHVINTEQQEPTSPSGTMNNVYSGQLLEFTISGMEANNLKRTIFGRPSPYVKVNLRPGRMQRKAWRLHHGSIGKTAYQSHTTEPSWGNEGFAFKASIWDILEVEVRNKSAGIKPIFTRFLGKLHFPLRELLTMGRSRTQTFTRQLLKKEPSHKVLGSFSLTIKTNCDLPGSRHSRRQASPEANGDEEICEVAERNGETSGELENGEEDRRPSLNASTPDDDQEYRERTSTVPHERPSGRSLVHVCVDQSQDAQSQPDLLGLPYTTHENVRMRKKGGKKLSLQLSNELTSRLSVPPHMFSSISVQGFDDFPSTSDSNIDDTTSRTLDNDNHAVSNGDDQQSSCTLEANQNVDVMNMNSTSVPDEGVSSLSIPSNEHHTADVGTSRNLSDTENHVNATTLDNTPQDANQEQDLGTLEHSSNQQEIQLTSNSNDIDLSMAVENGVTVTDDDGSEIELFIDDNGSGVEMDCEPVIVENETNVDASDTRTDSQSTVDREEENNEHDFRANGNAAELLHAPERYETSGEVLDNTNEELHTETSSCESPSFVPRSMLASSPSLDILTVELPPTDVMPSSFEEELTPEPSSAPSNEVEESIGLGSHEQDFRDICSANTTNTEEATRFSDSSAVSNDTISLHTSEDQESTIDNSPLMQERSSGVNFESTAIICNGEDSEQPSHSSVPSFGSEVSGHSLMDVESEPDIMNVFGISNPSSSDLVVSSRSTDLSDDTTPKRTLGSCNLRTLFQVPDNDNSLTTETSDDSQETTQFALAATISETTSFAYTNVLENSAVVDSSTDPVECSENTTVLSQGGDTEADSSSNDYESSPESANDRSYTENADSDETLERDSDLEIDEVVQSSSESTQYEEVGQAEGGPVNASYIDGTSDNRVNSSTSNQDSASAPSVSNERTTSRSATPARIPSITHVRYLRSKNVSIRIPSGTSTSLPVVHFVPPHIPLSPNSFHQTNVVQATVVTPAIKSETVLPATFVASNANLDDRSSMSTMESRSNPGGVFLDTQDGGHQSIGAEASTSHISGASATDHPGPSTHTVISHSASKRRSSSESAQGGNTKVKKKGKSRNRTTSREIPVAEHRENPAEVAAAAPVRRHRNIDGASNNQLDVPQNNTDAGEQRNDANAPRPASIYVQISDFATDDDVVSEGPLPPQWERAVDTYGRVYYIDHESRVTTWNKPSAASSSETTMNEENHHRQNLERRYQSFRRTLSGRRRRYSDATTEELNAGDSTSISDETTSATDATSPISPQPPDDTNTSPSGTSRPTPAPSRQSGDNRALLNSPFVTFLTRADLTTFLRSSGTPGQYYFNNPKVKEMVKQVKEDPRNYQRVMHDRSLVTFLNGFADPSLPLPRGWEQKTDQFGQKYFVDHNSRSTNFADPRLPDDDTHSRNRSRATLETAYADRSRRPPPPVLPRTNNNAPNTIIHRHSERRSRTEGITYNQQIVEFLRQPNIDTILSEKDPSYARNVSLKCNVDKIRRDGQRALRLLSDNVNLIVLLSLYEDDIVSWLPESQQTPSSAEKIRHSSKNNDDQGPSSRKTSKPAPYKRDFQAKVKSFHKNIIHNGLGQGSNKIQLVVRRDNILEDAFTHIMKENSRNLRNSKLEVRFSGEEGLDYGGPQREFFFLLSRELFNPYYGLFEYSAQDTYTLHISAMSSFVDNAHDWYRFSGRIIALVIIHQHLLDAFFTRPFYKLLLKSSCDLRDVEALDALFHRSLSWIMETDITDVSLDLAFTVSEEVGGQVTERELLPGGKDIRVTEDNKLGYVELMSNWRIDRGVSEQRKSILRGFYEIIDNDLVSMFDACELELLISGTADIDVNDWVSNTEYRSGYHPNHKVIRWFWQAVHSFDNEQRLRLLQFVTGTSSVPYEGFSALRGSTGPRKFCIEKWANHKMLPRAHTCFNRLDLPPYLTYNELLDKLTLAVEETSTFGIQ